MRIRDGSEDVCSSDLRRRLAAPEEIAYDEAAATGELCPPLRHVEIETAAKIAVDALKSEASQDGVQRGGEFLAIAGDGYKVTQTHQLRSEERRVGQEGVSTCRIRGSTDN